ncbi:MAG: hypothetical protein HYZ53_00845 [Planctomycetes bacterium]|nr:hypothetical protein [Planctomycetota bacterium]
MADKSFLDRFQRLELPEDRKGLDWAFLDAPLGLPEPLPLQEHTLLVLVNGHALLPADAPPEEVRSIRFHGEPHALTPAQPPSEAETAYRERHASQLSRGAKRFLDSIPVKILDDRTLLESAADLLRIQGSGSETSAPFADRSLAARGAGDLAPSSASSVFFSRLVGLARLLRIHEKLYDLVTLQEYARVFEKAIQADFFRKLQTLPATVAPEEMLRLIEESLDAIHAKARSPLRNKLSTCRLVVNGITLLPIYREAARGLFESYARLLDRKLKLDTLERHLGGRR